MQDFTKHYLVSKLEEIEQIIKELEGEYRRIAEILTEGADMKCRVCKEDMPEEEYDINTDGSMQKTCKGCKRKAKAAYRRRVAALKGEEKPPTKSLEETLKEIPEGMSYKEFQIQETIRLQKEGKI